MKPAYGDFGHYSESILKVIIGEEGTSFSFEPSDSQFDPEQMQQIYSFIFNRHLLWRRMVGTDLNMVPNAHDMGIGTPEHILLYADARTSGTRPVYEALLFLNWFLNPRHEVLWRRRPGTKCLELECDFGGVAEVFTDEFEWFFEDVEIPPANFAGGPILNIDRN